MIERFWTWLAWKLPRRLAYWAAIRVNAAATTDPRFADKTPWEVSVMDALNTWVAR